jgi:hypothetical protein
VWHKTKAEAGLDWLFNPYKMAKTNTAVFPIPDFA